MVDDDGWDRRPETRAEKKQEGKKRQGCRRFLRRTVIGWVDQVGNGHRSPCFWVRILAVFGQGIEEKRVGVRLEEGRGGFEAGWVGFRVARQCFPRAAEEVLFWV